MPKKSLVDLLSNLMSGKGIKTYPDGDEHEQRIHTACMNLEESGMIIQKDDKPGYVLWGLRDDNDKQTKPVE